MVWKSGGSEFLTEQIRERRWAYSLRRGRWGQSRPDTGWRWDLEPCGSPASVGWTTARAWPALLGQALFWLAAFRSMESLLILTVGRCDPQVLGLLEVYLQTSPRQREIDIAPLLFRFLFFPSLPFKNKAANQVKLRRRCWKEALKTISEALKSSSAEFYEWRFPSFESCGFVTLDREVSAKEVFEGWGHKELLCVGSNRSHGYYDTKRPRLE